MHIRTNFGTLLTMEKSKKLQARFFQTKAGNEPVREWLKSLDKTVRKTIGDDIQTVQYGWPLGMPLVDNLGFGIWEVRITLKNRIARVLFCMHEGAMMLLHGFIKKAQKTPKPDLEIAKKRKRELEKG